jgi:hypothetical protein
MTNEKMSGMNLYAQFMRTMRALEIDRVDTVEAWMEKKREDEQVRAYLGSYY